MPYSDILRCVCESESETFYSIMADKAKICVIMQKFKDY